MPITIDPGNTINDDLVGWWPMDEGSGTVANDVSGLGNHGELIGGVGWGSGPPGSDGATTYTFTTDEGITVPHDASLALVGDMTACAWINMPGFPYYQQFIGKGESYPNPYGLAVGPSGEIFAMSGDGSGQDYTTPSSNMSTGTWYFMAMVRNGSDLTAYTNAAANGTTSMGITPTDAGLDLALGNRTDFAVPFYGSLSHVRLWGRALSETELGYIYADILFGAVSVASRRSLSEHGTRAGSRGTT